MLDELLQQHLEQRERAVQCENGGFAFTYPVTGLDELPPTLELKPVVWLHLYDGRNTCGAPITAKNARRLAIALLQAAIEVKEVEAGWVDRVRQAEEAA